MIPKLNRRKFLRMLSVATTGSIFSCQTKKNTKPNIILIMADDLGYGDLGCYGNQSIKTPNIDELAANGVRFTDFHSNGAVCSPTRAALLTGRYQQRCGIESVVTAKSHRDKGMAFKETTFAEVLKSVGYSTALFGKWHLGYDVRFNPIKQGFDEFRGFVSGNIDYFSHIDQEGYKDWWQKDQPIDERGYTTELITNHALSFIDKNKNRAFCLYLAHETPHYPYQGPNDEAIRKVGNPKPVQGTRKDKVDAYKEMIEALDKSVGQVMKKLQELKLDKTTFVFFCSDNGPTKIGSAGILRGNKGSFWEGGHRVPAIVWWPGKIKSGIVCQETAMTMDLFPTMASISGAKLPKELMLDGLDLSNVLLNGSKLQDRTLFWKQRNKRAVRKGIWKLVGNELFNLENDLGEKNNLAKKFLKKVKELKSELRTWENDVLKGVTPVT